MTGLSGTHVVVVLSWHGREDTLRCVKSLVVGSPEATLLVIDNGSFDGVIDAVHRLWPEVNTLQTGSNLGFAGGMNRGLQWALERGASFVTVLNNDTVVPSGAIASLAERANVPAAVSPVVRYLDSPGAVWFGGGLVDSQTGLPRHMNEDEIARAYGRGTEPRNSQILAGCCITAPSEVWRRVGGFDERYFLMFEDSDWSIRAAAAQVPLVVDPAVEIGHRVSASFVGASSYLGLYYYSRNGLLFTRTRTELGLGARLRFLRRHVLPHVTGALRDRNYVTAGRRGIVILWALLAETTRRYGRAPAPLHRLARSWSERDERRVR